VIAYNWKVYILPGDNMILGKVNHAEHLPGKVVKEMGLTGHGYNVYFEDGSFLEFALNGQKITPAMYIHEPDIITDATAIRVSTPHGEYTLTPYGVNTSISLNTARGQIIGNYRVTKE